MASYRSEAIKALRGIGKYRLAPGYDQFYVDPIRYLRWSSERKREHAEIFFAYVPACSETFSRPSNAGLKSNPNKKRRRDQNEPEVFCDRFETIQRVSQITADDCDNQPKKVTPIKIHKSAGGTYVAAKAASKETEFQPLDPLDPTRVVTRPYYLVHRQDTKNCPRTVQRCQQCLTPFSNADQVVIRTTGAREYTCKKSGKVKSQTGNVYLHYIKQCLVEYDRKFSFPAIVVLHETMERLPESAIGKLRKFGLQFEQDKS